MTKKELLNQKTIATWYGGCIWYGAAIKSLDDEKIQLIEYAGDRRIPHTLKLYFNFSGDAYFILNGRRVKLADCFRV